MAHFDVLTEPWIPVELYDGSSEELGLLDILENAHNIARITDPSPLFEYGMHRLLTVFIMDAFHPEEQDDIEGLLNAGRFPMKRIRAYVEECQRNGPCFDLFDPDRPFLQSSYKEKWDETIKPVSTMIHNVPFGNNHIHFTHVFEAKNAFCPAVCTKALCAVNVFCTAGLQGPSSINGAPPVYVLVQGDNLFETICLNCIPVHSAKTSSYDDPPVLWKRPPVVEPGKKVAKTSLLQGMFFPARRIHLIPNEQGGFCTQTGVESDVLVMEMNFQKGLDFVGYASWRDPHVPYAITEKGRSSLKPKLGKETWRSIGVIYSDKEDSPDAVRQFIDLFPEKKSVPIVSYYIVANKAQYESWMRDELALDMRIARDADKLSILKDCLKLTEDTANVLRFQLKRVLSSEKAHPQKHLIEQAVGQFYASCRKHFLSSLCDELSDADIYLPGIADGIVQRWKDALRSFSFSEFNNCADRLGMSGRYLLSRAAALKSLHGRFKKSLGGGGEI
jgi:CRISPR system Cascade subunit CasA